MDIHQYCDLYYEDTLTNPQQEFDKVLILVHGNMISSIYWRPLIKYLQQQCPKLRCIACDLRGYGQSQSITQVETIHDLSNDVDNLITKLFPDWTNQDKAKNIYLAGWSLGGAVVMQLAVDYGDKYQKLILVASCAASGYAIHKEDENGSLNIKCMTREEVADNPRVKRNQQTIDTKDKAFNKMIFEKVLFNSGKIPAENELNEYLDEVFKQTNYTDTCWALNQFDISGGKLDQAKNIIGPVLIYHGKIDLVIPPIFAEGNAVEIGQEKCRVVIRENVGHMPPLEEPEELGKEIIEFLYK